MKLVRRLAALASMTMLGAGGFALATAGPAAAAGGNSTLSCVTGTQPSSGAPILKCTASDPDGIKTQHVAAKGSFASFSPAGVSAACNPTPFTGDLTLTFVSFLAPTYTTTVVDCQGNRDIYRVDAATGNVMFVKTVSPN